MRTHVIILSLLVLCIFNSCQKEFEDPNDSFTGTTSDFKAKVNGVQFVADISGAVIITDSIITLTGRSNDGQKIVFTVADSGGNLAIVSLDSVNRLMSGTFNFKAFRTSDGIQKIITEGVFHNISY